MFDNSHYVPVLKWRQSEYQSLVKLDSTVKDFITPLFEIPKENWDFEKKQATKNIDDHVAAFGKRLKAKWGSRRCFVDSCHLNPDLTVASGLHHLEHIFALAREEGTNAVPVFGINQSSSYKTAVKKIISADLKGGCLRLKDEDFSNEIHTDINSTLKKVGISKQECDLVIDLGAGITSSEKTQSLVWSALLNQIPDIGLWRSLTICATAFPAALPSSVFRPSGSAKRLDWMSYKELLKTLPKSHRIPTYGDYGTASTNTEMMDPRLMDPTAKIKYTTDDAWHILMGTQVKKYGREQYRELAARLTATAPKIYDGSAYSWADNYIEGCAKGTETTGGSSTWPSVALNRHMTKVVKDVAKFFGSSK